MTFRHLEPDQAPTPTHRARLTSRTGRLTPHMRRIDGRCPRCNKPWDDHPTSDCALKL